MDLEILKSLDVGGGCTIEDYKFLYGLISLIKPRRILEIGTGTGVSAITMALALRDTGTYSQIVTVDVDRKAQEIARCQSIRLGVASFIEFIDRPSSVVNVFENFDVVFIDGDHTYEGCKKDYEAVRDKSKYIIFHDAFSNGVSKLLKELSGSGLIVFEYGQLGEFWSEGKLVSLAQPGIAVLKR